MDHHQITFDQKKKSQARDKQKHILLTKTGHE